MSEYTDKTRNGYIQLIIRRALESDPEAVIYDWFPFAYMKDYSVIETVIRYSNGVISQYWQVGLYNIVRPWHSKVGDTK